MTEIEQPLPDQPAPYTRSEIRELFGVNFEAERALAEVGRWRQMSDTERGDELRDCLLLADAIGYEPVVAEHPS